MVKSAKLTKGAQIDLLSDTASTAAESCTGSVYGPKEFKVPRPSKYISRKSLQALKSLAKIKGDLTAHTKKALAANKQGKWADIDEYFTNFEAYLKRNEEALAQSFVMGKSSEAILSVLACAKDTEGQPADWKETVPYCVVGFATEWFTIPRRKLDHFNCWQLRFLYTRMKDCADHVKLILRDWAVIFKAVPAAVNLFADARKRRLPMFNYREFSGKKWIDNLKDVYTMMETEICIHGTDMMTYLRDYREYIRKSRIDLHNYLVPHRMGNRVRLFRYKKQHRNTRIERFRRIYNIVKECQRKYVNDVGVRDGIDTMNNIYLEVPKNLTGLSSDFFAKRKEQRNELIRLEQEKRSKSYIAEQKKAKKDLSNLLKLYNLLNLIDINAMAEESKLLMKWFNDPAHITPFDYFRLRPFVIAYSARKLTDQCMSYKRRYRFKPVHAFHEKYARMRKALGEETMNWLERPCPLKITLDY